jgi:hypothetical protein
VGACRGCSPSRRNARCISSWSKRDHAPKRQVGGSMGACRCPQTTDEHQHRRRETDGVCLLSEPGPSVAVWAPNWARWDCSQ